LFVEITELSIEALTTAVPACGWIRTPPPVPEAMPPTPLAVMDGLSMTRLSAVPLDGWNEMP